MRVMFFGTSAFAVPSLTHVATHQHTVAVCVTQPDRPQGRGLTPQPSPVKQAAARLGLTVAQPERVDAALCEACHPEIGVVAAYGQLIPPEVLSLPTHGMVGVHPSLLPAYRGAAPVVWALLNGETRTGVTIFRLNERLDAGEIIEQEATPITPDEDAEQLTNRLAEIGGRALLRALEAIADGRAAFVPQDEARVSLAPKLSKAQGWIDWQQPAECIARLVRATVPWPGATTTWSGRALKIWRAVADDRGSVADAAAGTILQLSKEMVAVATGRGALLVTEVQPEGRRRMRVQEFLAGHPLHVGERFGGNKQQATGHK